MSALLTAAAVLALVTDPSCGRLRLPEQAEFAYRLVATAMIESGGDPFIIGVNAQPSRGLPAAKVVSATAADAVMRATALLAQGRRIDLGLMQISNANLVRHGLTPESAFVACRSVAAAADHLADDFRAVWTLASRRYNCGRIDCGTQYAAQVDAVLARIDVPHPGPSPPADRALASAPNPFSRPSRTGRDIVYAIRPN
jgi:type IV secretion system protein VirB1